MVRSFRDLVVWQRAFELCVEVYRATEAIPSHERFGMVREQRETARSVLYNIAEGHKRRSTREYVRFLDIACGSSAELQTQFLLSKALGYYDATACSALLERLSEVDRMLAAITKTLRRRLASPNP